MVLVSYSGKEINAKLVYYGPGLSGKTTNLEYIYGSIPGNHRGKMVSMKTKTERTLFFDFLPVQLGELSGFKTRFLLYTVPGQVYYNATRKLVLKGVDAVVFVADSKRGKMDENLESLQNLRDNLKEHGLSLDQMPYVLQYNKRDLPEVYTQAELDKVLNVDGVPTYDAVAMKGDGVIDTFKGVSKLLLKRLAGEIGVPIVGTKTGPAAGLLDPAGEPASGTAPAQSRPVASQPSAPLPSPVAPASPPARRDRVTAENPDSAAGGFFESPEASSQGAFTSSSGQSLSKPPETREPVSDATPEPPPAPGVESVHAEDPSSEKSTSMTQRLRNWLRRSEDEGENRPASADGVASNSPRSEREPVAGEASQPLRSEVSDRLQMDPSAPRAEERPTATPSAPASPPAVPSIAPPVVPPVASGVSPPVAPPVAPPASSEVTSPVAPPVAKPAEPPVFQQPVSSFEEPAPTPATPPEPQVQDTARPAVTASPGFTQEPSLAPVPPSQPLSKEPEPVVSAEPKEPEFLLSPAPIASAPHSVEKLPKTSVPSDEDLPPLLRGSAQEPAVAEVSAPGPSKAVEPREVVLPLELSPEDLETGVVLRLSIQMSNRKAA